MSGHLIIPSWTLPDGTRSGPILPAATSEADAQRQVAEVLSQARRERGRDVLVQVVDSVTGHLVARVRPRDAA